MSLLLDALKKAAEQKAQKSKWESAPERTSDETLLEVAADDATRLDDDETEFDHSQLGVRLDRSGRERGVGDKTDLDPADVTQTQVEQDLPTGSTDDKTDLDPADATLTQIDEDLPTGSSDDKTDLDLADTTQTQIEQDLPTGSTDDRTDLDLADVTRTQIEQDLPTGSSDDKTDLDLADATQTQIDESLPTGSTDDKTDLDLVEVTQTQIEQDLPTGSTDDKTDLDLADATQTHIEQDLETDLDIPKAEDVEYSGEDDSSGHRQTEDDETVIFIAESATDTALEPGPGVGARSTTEDETDLNQLAAVEGLTDDHELPVDGAAAGDVTDLSQPIQDQTMGEEEKDSADGDADADETDFNQPSLWADQIARAQTQQPPEDGQVEEGSVPDRGVMDDEDLSLMLIEREETKPGLTAATSFTEAQNPQARNLALEDIAPGKEELGLADKTQKKVAGEQTVTQTPTLTSPTGTALSADETRTKLNSPTATRADSTSTRTYAPDNYDRTLMKVASDDASKLFSGMKSDSDVVMTPAYAKKVFRSKTSVQRVQHYRVYVGIVVVLALSIIIFGVFEYQDQSELIDSSLRPLKRDPMPGVIKMAQPEKTNLFVEPDPKVDARTVEIIESANQKGSIPVVEDTVSQAETEDRLSQAEAEDTVEQAGIIEAAPAPQLEVATAEIETITSEPRAETVQAPVARDDTDQVVHLTSSAPSTEQTDVKNNLHFTSSSQYQQTDILLREAYAAYLTGDNRLALSLYNQVLGVDPANRNALLARAAIQMQDGDIDAAIRDYQALLLANPKDSLAMSSLLAVSTYSPQETESQLKLMIREEPDSPYLNFALANAYGAQERWQEAQRHYFMALQNNPDDPNYAYNLAVSLEHISRPSNAITYYQRALDNFTKGLATFNRDVVNQRLEMLGKL